MESKNTIYSLARLAKERLKHNDYQMKPQRKIIDNATCFAKYISKTSLQEEKTKKEEKPQNTYEEELYKRVCQIIENKTILNPILSLIDKELFDTLDVEAKQFYINNLNHKYKVLRQRYFKEHAYQFYY